MAVELARLYRASITALMPENPSAPALRRVGSTLFDPCREERHRAYQAALNDFKDQAQAIEPSAYRATAPSGDTSLYSILAAHDIAVMAAESGIDGSEEFRSREIASLISKSRAVTVLRVRRRPWAIKGVVLVVGNAPGCAQLAQRLLSIGLWPDASISLLPVGDERPAVLNSVRMQAELLQAHGRRVVVLPGLGLNFEGEDMLPLISQFPVAVMAQLSYSAGYFDQVRNDAFEIAAKSCSLVLLPN
jgi:Fe2+ transport system protein FeoA